MKKKLEIGDKVNKGDIILVKDKEHGNTIVKVLIESQIESCGRIPVQIVNCKSDDVIDYSSGNCRLCVWITLYDYYKIDEKEAFARMI